MTDRTESEPQHLAADKFLYFFLGLRKGEIRRRVDSLLACEWETSEKFARLRAKQPRLRVLLTSGYIADDCSPGIKTDSRTAFLPKPFQLEDIEEAILKMREVA